MPAKRILVSWIGHADLSAMAEDQKEPERSRLMGLAKLKEKYGEKPGPLKTALSQGEFGQVHLLSDYDVGLHAPFLRWLGLSATIHPVHVEAPIDYPSIFKAADSVLNELGRTI